MNRDEWFEPKWKTLKRFCKLRLIGLAFAGVAMFIPEGDTRTAAVFFSLTMLMPLLFCQCFVPVLHWRERYKGERINLWGAFLVFETSGWSKLVYWFRHILPDSNRSGRYKEEP
jgi:hypothetical protein